MPRRTQAQILIDEASNFMNRGETGPLPALSRDTVGLFALRILSETPPPKYVTLPRSLFHDGGGGSPPSTTPSLARERGILLTPLLHD